MKYLLTIISVLFLNNIVEGQNWQRAQGIPDTLWIYDLATYDNYVFAATMRGIYRSDNGGRDWEPKNNGIIPDTLYARAFAKSGKIIYVANFQGVYATIDHGEHWFDLNLPNHTIALSIFADDSILLAGVPGGGLYRSTDYGTNWEGVTGDHIYKIAKYQNYYFAGSWFEVLVSSNYGLTWKPSGLNHMTYWVQNYHDTVFACPMSGGIYKTSPADINWNEVPGISFSVNGMTVCNDIQYVISDDSVYYRAGNTDGNSWHVILNTNLPVTGENYLWSIAVCNGNIIVGTENNNLSGAGIWYYSLGNVPVATENQITYGGECLFSPNPAKNFITMNEVSAVERITIYNMSGKSVMSVTRPASILDVSSLTPGVYVVKLECDNNVYIQKLVKE